VHPNSCFKTSQIFQCLASERFDVIRITPFVSTQLVTSKWVMDDNDALKVTSFLSYIFLVCHASFSLAELRWRISIRDKDRQGSSLVFVGHGYGGLVLKRTLVTLHDRLGFDRLGFYKDLRSNLCGIVFYGGTNTKFRGLKDWLFDDHLLELCKRFEAALDLKKVKVCVVNKNKSFLQVCILYPYSN